MKSQANPIMHAAWCSKEMRTRMPVILDSGAQFDSEMSAAEKSAGMCIVGAICQGRGRMIVQHIFSV